MYLSVFKNTSVNLYTDIDRKSVFVHNLGYLLSLDNELNKKIIVLKPLIVRLRLKTMKQDLELIKPIKRLGLEI